MQLRGEQRPGAVSVCVLQHVRSVLRLFRVDSGAAAYARSRDRGRAHSAGRCRVDARSTASRARYRLVVRGAADQRPRLHHVLRHTAAYETVYST